MIKFIIISRHKPGMTRERFFYEWAFIQVALMVQTPSSMRRIPRYVQHFANLDNQFDQPRGLLGKQSFSARLHDSVTVQARKVRPVGN